MSQPNPKDGFEDFAEMVKNKSSELALKEFKVKLLEEATVNGQIIPEIVFEMIDQEIKLWQSIK